MEARSIKQKLLNILFSALILGAGAGGCLWLVYEPEPQAAAAVPNPPALVHTIPLDPHTGSLNIKVDGVVVPYREIDVAGEVGGRVEFKADVCRAGNFVAKDTLLIQVDPRDYELEVRRLISQLKQAVADLDELEMEDSNTRELIKLAEEDLVLQSNELRRLQSLSEARAASDTEVDKAKQNELMARNTILSLNNQLRLLKSRKERLESAHELVAIQLERAELDLARTKIVAPTDGVIVADLVEQGDYVQKGTTLISIEDTSAVEVKCSLRMEQLYWLWRQAADDGGGATATAAADYQIPRTPVTIVYQLGGSSETFRWSGILSRYDGIGLDEKTRTVPCRVVVDRPRDVNRAARPESAAAETGPPALVRGMYVSVEIHLRPPTTLVRIPERAVRPGKTVWLARGDQLEIRRPLRLIELISVAGEQGETDRYWLVDADASSLTTDDKVIDSPLAAVTDKMAIREQASE